MSKDLSSFARRNFIRDSGLMIAGGAIGGAMAVGKAVQGGQAAPIKVAIVGCGRRARELAETLAGLPGVPNRPAAPVRIVALADRFGDQVQSLYRGLRGKRADLIDANCLRCSGADCLQDVLESDAEAVYVTTPPVARPELFRRLVTAGKHVFLEKPLAADVAGVLDMRATAEQAQRRGLCVHVGFQRRYDACYRETIAQVQQGSIGEPVFARAYCNAGPLRPLPPRRQEIESDYQLRHWNHFQWTGGDFLLEQHVAGLDVIAWALGQTPQLAQGQGGWADVELTRHESLDPRPPGQPPAGEVFDHHSVEYEFDNAVILMSQCRRVAKAWNHTGEQLHGTAGRADLTAGKIYARDGSLLWRSDHRSAAKVATANQQAAFLASIREGRGENQVPHAADSTLFALLGHQATRTGKRVAWNKLINAARFASPSPTPVS